MNIDLRKREIIIRFLTLVKQKNYMISTSINAEDIGHLVQSVRLVDEPQLRSHS